MAVFLQRVNPIKWTENTPLDSLMYILYYEHNTMARQTFLPNGRLFRCIHSDMVNKVWDTLNPAGTSDRVCALSSKTFDSLTENVENS